MPDPTDALAKVQSGVARVRTFLKTFDQQLVVCARFCWYGNWHQRIALLTDSVSSLALQVDRLAKSVESICDVVQGSGSPSSD